MSAEIDDRALMQWCANTVGMSQDQAVESALSYARRITANIRTEQFDAEQSECGGICYSYQASVQQFEVIIRVKGNDRQYIVRGIDPEGNYFEKEFDPYAVDPEQTVHEQFATICLYIQRTEKYADAMMRDSDKSEVELPKPNHVSILGRWGNMQAESSSKELLEGTMRFRNAVHGFWDKKPLTPGVGKGVIGFSLAAEP